MDILDPAGGTSTASRQLAARPGALGGLVIGILDNSKPNAAVLLEALAAALRERVGAGRVRAWQKPGASTGAAPGVLDEIAATCRVALTASAD
jgi:hypothetical protein